MAQNKSEETSVTSGSSSPGATSNRFADHLARSATSALTGLLGTSTIELLSKLGPEATTPRGLAYFIENVRGKFGALRTKAIRDILLSNLEPAEAIGLCQLLQLPVIAPLQTLLGTNFDAAPSKLELLGRWYGVANEDFEMPSLSSEGSQKTVASHKLHAHQLSAFRELRLAIGQPPCSALVHMPLGAGKLRLVATAVVDLYRSQNEDRSIVWLAPGTAVCEEAFLELQDVWQQLGSRDATIFQLYGDRPKRDLDQLGGAIAVIDILQLSKDTPALEKLGSVTSVVVLADAESLIHPVGAEIIRKMSAGGSFSIVGILATSGFAISAESDQSALSVAFPDAYITVGADNELQFLRELGDFADIEATVEHLTANVAMEMSVPYLLDFDQAYVNTLGNNVERNEHLLNILQRESAVGGRIILYATTAENAKLLAALLSVKGVPARSITADESPASRAISLQKFVAREEKVLCIHGFLLSGSSVPDIAVCVMALPAKSKAVFLSTIGRLVQARSVGLPKLRLIVAADSQADTGWVESLSTWSSLKT